MQYQVTVYTAGIPQILGRFTCRQTGTAQRHADKLIAEAGHKITMVDFAALSASGLRWAKVSSDQKRWRVL